MRPGPRLAPIVALLAFACVDRNPPDDELGEGSETGDELDAGSEGTDESTNESGTDEIGTDESDDGDDTGTDETGDGDGDCPLGEYIPDFITLDYSGASGWIVHHASYSALGDPQHSISARFYTSDFISESWLCVEPLVEPVGVDSCRVWYTQGQGKGKGPPPSYGYEDLPVDTLTVDVGEGPLALEVSPPSEFTPTSYGAVLPPPPDGVPFAGIATVAATFDGLPDLDLDLPVPDDILPLAYPVDSATLTDEELTSWTWSAPGGATPLELEITLASTPIGEGWTEWVQIECEVEDDGEFALPIEYLDLARDRLGPELHASVQLTRENRGSVPLVGKELHWRSRVSARLAVEVVD